MNRFTCLPLELTSDILKCLAIRDLLVLLRVNKKLNQAGEQVLYQNVELIWRRKRREALQPVQQSSFRKLHDLVLNTLRHPPRSTYVQHLHVDLGCLKSLWGPTCKTIMAEAELELLKEAVALATLSLPEREEWLSNLMAGIPNAYVGLLLFQMRNIKVLSIGHPGGISQATHLNSKTMEEAFIPVLNTHFPSLEEFRYMTLTDEPLTDTIPTKVEARHFIPFLNAPRIRSMSLYLFTTQEIFTTVPQASSTLTELVLHKFLLGNNQLNNLFRATPNLQVLSLDYWVDCEDTTVEKPHLDIPQLFYVLSSVQKSLREFKLSTRFFSEKGIYYGIIGNGGDYFDSTSWGLKGSAPPMKHFEQLRTLELPTAVLLGWNYNTASSVGPLLPPTLLKLTLRDDLWNWARYTWNYEVLANILEKFRTFRTQYANGLQNITLTDSSERSSMTDEDEEMLIRLKLSFDNEGLDFDLATYEDPFTPGVEGNMVYLSDDDLDM